MPFANHQDFINQLEKAPPETLLPEFISQLNQAFKPDLLDLKLVASCDQFLLLKDELLPLLYYQNRLYFASPKPSPAIVSHLEETFHCQAALYPIEQGTFEYFTQLLSQIRALQEPQLKSGTQPEDQPVSKTFMELLELAQHLRASDIHLEPQADHSILVRYRIDGLLHDIETFSSHDFDYSLRLVSKIKVAAELDIAETRMPQDGRITEVIKGEPVDLRVSTLPSMHGEKVVIRLLPHKNPFTELRDLGLEGEGLITYYNWIKNPQGMILITGQTGSGKTSTLYTTLSQILHTEKNVVTIEDPIEYQLKGVTQVQVHPKVGLTFASGLRSILRQDPDTILLGEIRDSETAEIAYQAALTGHMVLSTLHTNDAPSAIIRLMDIGVEPYLIASATLGVVAQRLIRKVCPHCAQPYTPGQDLMRSLGLPSNREYTFYRAVGCEQCFQTGYYGREGIFEVMPVDEELANLISAKEQLSYIRAHLQEQKIQSLFESAVSKVEKGITTVDEIHRVIPPTQQKRSSATGSVFIFMLFLISILSVLILNTSGLLESKAQIFHIERNALRGTYAAQAALTVASQNLNEQLSQNKLYFIPKDTALDDPLSKIEVFSKVLNEIFKFPLDEGLAGEARIRAKPESRTQNRFVYEYQILGKGVLSDNHDKQISPVQSLQGKFNLEIGALPLSFVERYPDQSIDPSIALPTNLWPSINEPQSAKRPAVYLAPLEKASGEALLPEDKQPALKVFNPNESAFALAVYGDIESLILKAPGQDSQVLEINQRLNPASVLDANGYQTISILKTVITEDLRYKRFQISSQQWQYTLNLQKAIIKQHLVSNDDRYFTDQFSGLVLVNGAINEIAGEDAAYARPLSIFSSNDIGLATSLIKQPQAVKANLGLITPEGEIRFSPLQSPLASNWRYPHADSLLIQAALAAGRFEVPEKLPVTIKGALANLKGDLSQALQIQSDPALKSLSSHPPFYPILNPDSLAVLISKEPYGTLWHEVKNP